MLGATTPVGFCTLDVKPPGPVQLKGVVEPTELKLNVPPMHTGPLFAALAEKHGKLQSNVAPPEVIGIKLVSLTN